MDIQKLAAHRDEVQSRGAEMYPVMLVIDSAPLEKERMTQESLAQSQELVNELKVGFLYTSRSNEIYSI